MPGWDFAHVQDDVNLCILRMLEGTFSLDAGNIILYITIDNKWKIGSYLNLRLALAFPQPNDFNGFVQRFNA